MHQQGLQRVHHQTISRKHESLASFLPVRAKALKNLESQIFVGSKAKQPDNQVTSLH